MAKRIVLASLVLLVSIIIVPIGQRHGVLSHLGVLSAQASQDQPVLVEKVVINGAHRIPDSTIRIWISTREGDPYNPAALDRDVRALYAQGHFSDVKVFALDGTRGGKIVTFELEEWPLILDIAYEGLKSVAQSKVLEEYRKRQLGISRQSQYDPVKVKRAAEVIKELLADEGHPDAKVDAKQEQISKTAIKLIFKVDEGERVRVAEIQFEGNKVFSNSYLRAHMKYVKQVGILTTFTSKDIYHKEKLQADLDRLRVLVYSDKGYLRTSFGEPKVENVGEVGTWLPLLGHKGKGIKLVIPVNEGRQYTAGQVNVEGNTEFTQDQIKTVLGIKLNEIVRGPEIQKALDNLKKLYGSRGYIQFDKDLGIDFHDSPTDPTKGVADLTFRMVEGKQYTLHRLEFIGNTFTREHVLRREVLLNEGDRYNSELWDLSLLRLNQLGYFEQIKDEDVTVNTDERRGLVDLTVKVQEKGRQQISFTGGASGIGGSFVGINYSTNNLFGYGESLAVGLAAGNRQKSINFGITEPYFRGKPISIGFNVFAQDLQFLGSGFGEITDPNILNLFSSNELFTQRTAGASVSISAPLSYFAKRFRMGRFVRLGLSYSFSTTDIVNPTNTNQNFASQTATAINLATGVNLVNSFPITFAQKGVQQSTISPSLTYNTLNNSLDPTAGKAFTLGLQVSGGPFGGKVNTITPSIEFKYFRPLFAGKEQGLAAQADPHKTRTFGFRILFSHIGIFGTPFQSNSLSFVDGVPLFSRFYLGGDYDIRGYDIRSISPFVPLVDEFSTQNVFVTDAANHQLKVRNPAHSRADTVAQRVINRFTFLDQPVPLSPGVPQQEVPLGSDSEALANFEYRIPIFSVLSVVPFFDIGSAFNLSRAPDQFVISDFQQSTNPLDTITLDPRGLIATPREIRQARTPETPPGLLPSGFRPALVFGEQQSIQVVRLSQASNGFLQNYRYSTGLEFRVQVPVINVPVRLIFALNPNANVNDPFVIEKRRAIRFSIGRTF